MGEVFILGGLAGVPFTGTTGWGAFSHHVPDDGNIFVLYAPHVGISDQGKVGYVHRPGMKNETKACGSAIGAFQALQNSTFKAEASPSAYDYQQSYMTEALGPAMTSMLEKEGNSQMEELARQTFKIVQKVLYEIMPEKHHWMTEKSKLVLLGGIMINVDGTGNDMFAPQNFTSMDKNGNITDLMESFKNLPVESETTTIIKPEPIEVVDLLTNWQQDMPPKQLTAIKKHFPTALPGAFIEQMAFKTLENLGFNKNNTVFTFSSCPDELNHNNYKEDVTKIMAQRWGESFPLGGLAGIPFTGKTGWIAFSHHIPEQGNIFAMYGPHVGVTEDGEVGKINRPGMKNSTKACGASIGAYKHILKPLLNKTDHKEGKVRLHDQQINYIIDSLRPRMGTLEALMDEESKMA